MVLLQLQIGSNDVGTRSFFEPFILEDKELIVLLVYRAPFGSRFCV